MATPKQNLDYVCQMFEYISNQSGRNEKIRLLQELKDQGGEIEKIATNMLSIALDWYRHYGIATLPPIEKSWDHPKMTFNRFLEMVDHLERGIWTDRELVPSVYVMYHPTTAKWLRRCLLKNLDMGVGEKTVNKVWPGLIRTFSCMLAEDFSYGDLEALNYPVLVEPKVDGVRAICFVEENGVVTFLSRGGNELVNLDAVKAEIRQLFSRPGVVLDGELYVDGLHKTLSVVRSTKSEPDPDLVNRIRYYVFDKLTKEEWENGHAPGEKRVLWYRMHDLKEGILLEGQRVKKLRFPDNQEWVLCNNAQEVEKWNEVALQAGFEGVMIKDIYANYAFDRSKAWFKYKPWEVDTFKITGFYEGQGKHEGRLGGFNVEVQGEDGIAECGVGGGYTDEEREMFWNNRERLIGREITVKYKPTPGGGNSRSVHGKLREPVFVDFTLGENDKVSLEPPTYARDGEKVPERETESSDSSEDKNASETKETAIEEFKPDALDIQCDMIFSAMPDGASTKEKISLLEQCLDYLRLEEAQDNVEQEAIDGTV